jgi:hypothetical protein
VARIKTGRNAKEPPKKKLLATKHSALKRKDYDIIHEGDSEESLTNPAPLRQRRSKMKLDPTFQVEIPPRQTTAENRNDKAESEDSSPHGYQDQVFAKSLNNYITDL